MRELSSQASARLLASYSTGRVIKANNVPMAYKHRPIIETIIPKPVIAIKPMAGGRFLGHQAFEYVFDEIGVQASMFGMGTIDQVRETTRAARVVLGAA